MFYTHDMILISQFIEALPLLPFSSSSYIEIHRHQSPKTLDSALQCFFNYLVQFRPISCRVAQFL